tara:strand:- start:277 stop:459 length:183 start_codon:yes stop_codon:yes gene_type:complete
MHCLQSTWVYLTKRLKMSPIFGQIKNKFLVDYVRSPLCFQFEQKLLSGGQISDFDILEGL